MKPLTAAELDRLIKAGYVIVIKAKGKQVFMPTQKALDAGAPLMPLTSTSERER